MLTQTRSTGADTLQAAVDRLRSSERGRAALRALVDWMDGHGAGLDGENQDAVLTLLLAAWGPQSGTAREVMKGGKE